MHTHTHAHTHAHTHTPLSLNDTCQALSELISLGVAPEACAAIVRELKREAAKAEAEAEAKVKGKT